MFDRNSILRIIAFGVVAVPFALLLIYFLHIEFQWTIASAATVVAVAVTIIFGILDLVLEPTASDSTEKSASNLIEDIFGPETEVELIEDTEEFGQMIKSAADNAVNSVERIHFNMHYVNRTENNFADKTVDHRVLLAKPIPAKHPTASGKTGTHTGFDTVYDSNIDTNPSKDQFIQRYELVNQMQEEGTWDNVDVKLYETTPWLRAAIIDGSKAGFLLLPSMYEGSKAAKFWTEDPNVIDTLQDIYDDVWHDPRTVDFEEWYEDGSNIQKSL
jgi:hypothetical protein